MESAILKVLIEEVRLEKASGTFGYNRMHRRHNRSGPRPSPIPQDSPEESIDEEAEVD